jgi:hypothetical protein
MKIEIIGTLFINNFNFQLSIFNFQFPIASAIPFRKGRKKDPVSLSPASEATSRRAEYSFPLTLPQNTGVCLKGVRQ